LRLPVVCRLHVVVRLFSGRHLPGCRLSVCGLSGVYVSSAWSCVCRPHCPSVPCQTCVCRLSYRASVVCQLCLSRVCQPRTWRSDRQTTDTETSDARVGPTTDRRDDWTTDDRQTESRPERRKTTDRRQTDRQSRVCRLSDTRGRYATDGRTDDRTDSRQTTGQTGQTGEMLPVASITLMSISVIFRSADPSIHPDRKSEKSDVNSESPMVSRDL
jgi:hypothetical protein